MSMTAKAGYAPPDEDALRAQVYGLMSRLLASPPDDALLRLLQDLEGDESEIGLAYRALAAVARETSRRQATQEYQELFIGIGQGELIPFGSYYLTGFLHEKPLAELRRDMAALGIARADDVREPEDHIAALMEMMAGLVLGSFTGPVDLASQQAFFDRHVGGWAPRFFEDLQAAEAARFYMPVGRLGALFMEIERQGFEMAA